MKQIGWGFIGCGEVTEKKSGPAFNEVPGSKVVAVMSRNEAKAKSYAKRHDIKRWYTDPQQLIDDPEVTAVYIATPPSSHATFAIMAMKAGKPVYIEKPLAASYEDCARINRISEITGVPCFVAYYRRYLPYFKKVKQIIDSGEIGTVTNVQIRFAVPPRDLDYSDSHNLPWRLQPDIAGAGYCSNRAHLYKAEDTISACFYFENGLPGSGSWCFVGHKSAKEDCIEVIGEKGMLSFSVYNYDPIQLVTSNGKTSIVVPNPPYVQLPIIKAVIEHLQGTGICTCTSVSATPVNWVMDRILGKL